MTDEMPHDDELRSAYRRLPADEPPGEVDAAILGTARRRSDEERRRRRIRRIRMSVPLAAAAGMILTLTLTHLGDDRRGALAPLGETSSPESRAAAEMDRAQQAAPAAVRDEAAPAPPPSPAAPPPAPAPAPAPAAPAAASAPSPLAMAKKVAPSPKPKKERMNAAPAPEAAAESAPGSRTEGGSHRSLGYIEGVPPVGGSGDAAVGGEPREREAGAAELHDEAKSPDHEAPAVDDGEKRAARDSAAIASFAGSALKPDETARLAARRLASPSAAPSAPVAPLAAAPWPFGLEAALDADETCRRITGALHQACAFRDGVAVVTVDPPVAADRGALAGRRVSLLTLTLRDGRLARVALKLPSADGASVEEAVLDAEAGPRQDR